MKALNIAILIVVIIAGVMLFTNNFFDFATSNKTQLSTNISSETTEGGTATNIESIDVADTNEDPAYAEAGEALAKEAAAGVVGSVAPPATMTTIDGGKINLSSFYGNKPIYLKFWATWCVPCRQQTPGFEKTYKKFGDKLETIAVNLGYSDDEASIRAFKKKFGMSMPIAIDDGTLARLFNVKVTPMHVLIGKDARIKYIGHAENEKLDAAIQQVLLQQTDDSEIASQPAVPHTPIKAGDEVPSLSVKTTNGQNIPLMAKPGRLLAVNFFSSWCEWYLETSRPETSKACARTRTAIESLSSENLKIDWVGIAGGPWATLQDLLDYQKKNNISIPLALDDRNVVFAKFGVRDIPTVVLIDDSGRVVKLIGPAETDLSSAIHDVSNRIKQ